ncbi:MAG: hypothetical protein LBK99_15495, partial [Opitutaceae bacterium]|nr:hypothetical protein [Opitutaceae bacterium]
MTPATPATHHLPAPSIRFRFLAGLSILACAAAATAAETTLLDNDFEKKNPAATGWASWYTTNPATGTVATEQVGDSTNAWLNITSTTSFRGVYHLLAPSATLAEGDTLTLTFRLMFTATTSNVRFGLFRYAGGEQDTTNGTSDNGYFANVSSGGTTVSLARDGDPSNDPCSGSTNTITPTTSATATTPFAANTWYDVSFTLTVISKPGTGNTTMQVNVSIGDATATGTRTSTATGNNFDFGMIYIGSGNNNARFAIDDVLVTTTATITAVPEPRTTTTLAALAALGSAALA